VRQTFDRVSYQGIDYKLEKYSPQQTSRNFQPRITTVTLESSMAKNTQLSKRYVLGYHRAVFLDLFFYLMYVSDIPQSDGVITSIYVDHVL